MAIGYAPRAGGGRAGAWGMAVIAAVLACWQLDIRQLRERMYHSPSSHERERWHALPAPAGLRLQATQGAPAQGRRGEARGLRGGVRRPAGRGAGERKVQEQMVQLFAGMPGRSAEVQSRCRRTLQALAETATAPPESHQDALHRDPIGASVKERGEPKPSPFLWFPCDRAHGLSACGYVLDSITS
jgi:hypothetical protein